MAKRRRKADSTELRRQFVQAAAPIQPATMAIGVDVTWWGGSYNRRDDSHTECVAYAIKRDGVWSLPQFRRVDLGNFNPEAEPTEPNADPEGQDLLTEIASIIEAHNDIQNVVISLDAPLLAVERLGLPPRRKSQEAGAAGNVARRLCDDAWAVSVSMSPAGWRQATIQPGAPLSPRIKRLVENFTSHENGFYLYQYGNMTPQRCLIECFPNEVIWSAGVLGYCQGASYASMSAYKSMGKKNIRLPLNILKTICAHTVRPCLNVSGLNSDEWFECLWDWMLSASGRLRCDQYGPEGKSGKCFDDAIDSMLALIAAAAFVNGNAHVHQGDDAADGHIIGPGLPQEQAANSIMNMHDYFYGTFPSQLGRLAFRRPNDVVREQIMRDPSAVFFGGPDWENVASDLGTLPEQDRCRFIFSLFMVILTDQALYTYFPNSYEGWRARTNFPKFGWSGFRPHHVNPFNILWVPERDRVIDTDELLALVPEFVSFFVDETTNYFRQHLPEIDVHKYFAAIRNDNDYKFNEGAVVPLFKTNFEALTNGET